MPAVGLCSGVAYVARCMHPAVLCPDFCAPALHTAPQADLTDPSSLPAAMVGVSTVIDCATARPEESTDKVRRKPGLQSAGWGA